MTNVVVSYVNPDLDGVACALAIQHLAGSNWSARRFGQIDDETIVVLAELGLQPPPVLSSWEGVDQVWLVDTHHLKQLPPEFPAGIVVKVTDHHAGGDVEAFARATVQNEAVGAAATLLTEDFLKQGQKVPSTLAVLLQAAIASNTLEFLAPATNSRDREMFTSLSAICPLSDALLGLMREARRAPLKLPTLDIVQRDVKALDTAVGVVIVAQIEASGALELLKREDLVESLDAVAQARVASGAIVNIVDTALRASAIVSSIPALSQILAQRLNEPVGDDGIIRCARVLQRKTDIFPHLRQK